MKRDLTRVLGVFLMIAMLCSLCIGCGSSAPSSSGTANTSASAPAASGDSGAASKEVQKIHWVFADSEPVASKQHAAVEAWLKQVSEATDGQITYEYLGGGALGAEIDTLERMKNGAEDLCFTASSAFEGLFPYITMLQLPMLGIPDGNVGTNLLWDLYEKYPDSFNSMFDKQGVHALGLFTTDSSCIGTIEPIHNANDIKGLRLRANGGPLSSLVKGWGATPFALTQAEIYESVEKNVVDGFLNVWPAISSFKLYEVCPNYLALNMFVNPLMVLIGQNQWNALTPELQATVESLSLRKASIDVFYGSMHENTLVTLDVLKEKGSVVYTPTAEEIAGFEPAGAAVCESWLKTNESACPDINDVYKTAKELIASY